MINMCFSFLCRFGSACPADLREPIFSLRFLIFQVESCTSRKRLFDARTSPDAGGDEGFPEF